MRIKFIILLIGMVAYGYYLHSFSGKVQTAVSSLSRTYQVAIDEAANSNFATSEYQSSPIGFRR